MNRARTEGDPLDEKKGRTEHERRAEILHEELERRLKFLESSNDSIFGEFTTVDWVVCTLLFFLLPLLVMGLMVL